MFLIKWTVSVYFNTVVTMITLNLFFFFTCLYILSAGILTLYLSVLSFLYTQCWILKLLSEWLTASESKQAKYRLHYRLRVRRGMCCKLDNMKGKAPRFSYGRLCGSLKNEHSTQANQVWLASNNFTWQTEQVCPSLLWLIILTSASFPPRLTPDALYLADW